MFLRTYLTEIASSLLVVWGCFFVVCMIVFLVYSNVLLSSLCALKTSWLAFPRISQMVAYCWVNCSSIETAINTLIGFTLIWIVAVRTRQSHLVANIHKYTFLEYDIKYPAANILNQLFIGSMIITQVIFYPISGGLKWCLVMNMTL